MFFNNKYDVFLKNVRPVIKKIPQATVKKLLVVKDDLKIPAVMGLLHKDWWLFVLKNTVFISKTLGRTITA